MKQLVQALCSEETAGRAPGTQEGIAARKVAVDALRAAGLDPAEQPVPGCNGANVIATLPGDIDRWVLVAAHYDHLGRTNEGTFWGADDNAAAIAILVEVATALVRERASGRGLVFAAFDSEEPPYFLSPAMGSEHYARHPTVPLDKTDMMVCMDLVGHAMGPEEVPRPVRETVFALGAERSTDTRTLVDSLCVEGVNVRRIDADLVPALSDYDAFYRREVPFLFLTNGRSRYYHTPDDTPDRLDYEKMSATAQWLERFVRATCERPDARIEFCGGRDDASTLRTLIALTEWLRELSDEAVAGCEYARTLLAACDQTGKLPDERLIEVQRLALVLEEPLA